MRGTDDKLCALVIVGVTARGKKRFLAIEDGVREGSVAKFGDALKKLEFCSPPDTFRRQVSENFLLCGRNFG